MESDMDGNPVPATPSHARITWRGTVTAVLVVAVSLLGGCGNGEVPGAGASRAAKPSVDLTLPDDPAELPDSTSPPDGTSSTDPSAPADPLDSEAMKLAAFQATLNTVLINDDRTAAQVVVTQRASAGGQILVTWVTNDGWDADAKNAVRVDALTILAQARKSDVAFTWLLLMATGGTVANGKKKQTVVVRAKYSAGLVKRTDWASVGTDRVFQLPDDKPAVIDPLYV
jgi:hypothetical protein